MLFHSPVYDPDIYVTLFDKYIQSDMLLDQWSRASGRTLMHKNTLMFL